MTQQRLILTTMSILTLLAITATPASATFQANQPNTTQGPLQLKAGTTATLTNGAAAVTCTTLENGEWHIQTKFSKVEVINNITKVKQDLTKDGPHQGLTGRIIGCTASGLAATVNSSCQLQIIQISSTLGRGAVKSICAISIPAASCTIAVTAGNPNTNLEEVKIGNGEGGQKSEGNVTGITTTVEGAGCELAGIKGGKTSELKQTLIAHSEKVE